MPGQGAPIGYAPSRSAKAAHKELRNYFAWPWWLLPLVPTPALVGCIMLALKSDPRLELLAVYCFACLFACALSCGVQAAVWINWKQLYVAAKVRGEI